MNLRFKVISLNNHVRLETQDSTGAWHEVPVVGLTEEENDELHAALKPEEKPAASPAVEPAANDGAETTQG